MVFCSCIIEMQRERIGLDTATAFICRLSCFVCPVGWITSESAVTVATGPFEVVLRNTIGKILSSW